MRKNITTQRPSARGFGLGPEERFREFGLSSLSWIGLIRLSFKKLGYTGHTVPTV